MKKLPREIWLIILEIKTKNAIKEQLKKKLEFPRIKSILGSQSANSPFMSKYYLIETNNHSWTIVFTIQYGNIHYEFDYKTLTRTKITKPRAPQGVERSFAG